MSEDPVREWILSEGKATQITKISPVGSGCINLANHYDTDAGSFFVKTNRNIGPLMFEAEALGLGRKLADMHKAGKSEEGFGFDVNNTIGQRVVKSMGPLFDNVVIEPCLLHGTCGVEVSALIKMASLLYLTQHVTMDIMRQSLECCAGLGGIINLFGSGYRSSAMSIIDDYLWMLNA
uniref:Protein-ribulosamine 3-kinase n=1 Tax=Fagus sylvatica TaxID=28930 RepID=A0A2N9JAX3_FAGSY